MEDSGLRAWQRPYLNVFKHFRVEEWKRSAKEGDVAALMDARLKGTVYRIRGSVPSSSYLQLPRAGTQSLGLVGRYLYLLFRPLPHKHFLVHLDVTTEDRQEVRISFSTLFKEFKFTDTWLQFPFVCGAAQGSAEGTGPAGHAPGGAAPADPRWTCLVLDLPSILRRYLRRRYSHLRSVRLCCSLLVKNLCTSDLLFDPGVTFSEARQAGLVCHGVVPMPREMAFPVPKGRSWHDLYDYIRFPSEGSELPLSSIRKSCPEPVAGGQVPEDLICQPAQDRVPLSPHTACPRALPHRCPARPRGIPEPSLAAPRLPALPRAIPAQDQELEKQQRPRRDVGPAAGAGTPVCPQQGTEGTSAAAQAARQVKSSRASPPGRREARAGCVLQRDPGGAEPQPGGVLPSASQSLLPDPILKLKKIIGFGGCSTKWALWTEDSAAVVYPCHAVIVTLQLQTGEQRFFIGHTDKVSALALNSSSTLLASTQLGAPSVGRLWDFPTGSCLAVFQAHIHSLTSLSLAGRGGALCGAGRDGRGRTVVVVWNTAQVTCGGEVSVLAKAHPDVDIQTLKFAFLDDTRLASCGSANVRLWRLRGGALRSCPLALGHLQLLHCTDLAFHQHHHTLFVSSRSGHVLEVDYRQARLRSVRLLPPAAGTASGPGAALSSISLSSGLCATGSADGCLRLWPLDLSAALLEAGHEAPLSSICISPDSSKVLSTTSAGSLCCLHVPSRQRRRLLRSHRRPLLGFALQALRGQLATVSQDGTIRVWHLGSMQQLHEFSSAEDMPCAVAFHPTQQILACGFSSGLVQTFSLASSELLVEHRQHHAAVSGLTFSPDGQFMFSSCLQGTLALYSCLAEKSQVLKVLGRVVAPGTGSAAATLALSEDSRLLAFVGPSKCRVTVMEACSLHQLLRVDISTLGLSSRALGSARRLCFAAGPAGQLLVATSSGRILVLDAETGQLLQEVPPVHKLSCSALALSKDGRHLLTAAHKAIRVCSYQQSFHGNCQVYIGHSEPVCQVAFTPDQQHVVSVGDAIFLWDFLALPAERPPPAGPCSPRASLLPGAEGSPEELQDGSEAPRQKVPQPLLPCPPRPAASSALRAGCRSIFSESEEEAEEEAELLGSRVLWHGDSDGPQQQGVLESVGKEELPTVRPRVRQESFRSEAPAGGAGAELQRPLPVPAPRPACRRHFAARPAASLLPASFLSPPAGRELLKLKAVIGYNGNGRGNMVWDPDTGFFAYTCGCLVVVEDLHSGAQSHWLGHPEEISTLAISHDAQVLASASGRRDGDLHCQICLWKVQAGACTARLCHHSTQVQAMAFSRDGSLLVTLGDYRDQSIAVWDTCTHQLLASAGIPQPAHEVAFSPLCPRELACVGEGALMLCFLEQQGPGVKLKVLQAPAPEVLGPVELTSLCYGANPLLYSGTSSGQVCVWDTETSCCFLTWEADEGEIGVLLCGHHRLVSGSSTKRIRLWAVGTAQELRLKGPEARGSSVLLEQELSLDGAIVSAAFDERLAMGIVGTAAGTLWYINWAESSSSIRLISGHRDKVTQMCFSPEESLCATCAQDGSLRVWALGSLELVLQFQVLNQSCQCLAWKPAPAAAAGAGSQQVVAGYSDGTVRVFSVSRTELELKLRPHGPAVTAVAYSTDGELILSGAEDGLVALSCPHTGSTLRVLADHRGSPITALQCTRKQQGHLGLEGSELWLAASWDGQVSVWASDGPGHHCQLLDWLSFPAPASPQGLKSLPPSLAAFCPWEPGTLVYVGFGVQKEALFYSLHKKQVVRKVSLPYFATSLSLAPAGRFLAVGFGERLLRLLRCDPSAAQDFAGHDDSVHYCCFSPSGRCLLTASHSAVLLWELTGG